MTCLVLQRDMGCLWVFAGFAVSVGDLWLVVVGGVDKHVKKTSMGMSKTVSFLF